MEFIKRGRAAQEQARKHDKQQEKRKAMRGGPAKGALLRGLRDPYLGRPATLLETRRGL